MAKVLDFDLETTKIFCDKWLKWSRENREVLGDFADKVTDFMETVKARGQQKQQQETRSSSESDS